MHIAGISKMHVLILRKGTIKDTFKKTGKSIFNQMILKNEHFLDRS